MAATACAQQGRRAVGALAGGGVRHPGWLDAVHVFVYLGCLPVEGSMVAEARFGQANFLSDFLKKDVAVDFFLW